MVKLASTYSQPDITTVQMLTESAKLLKQSCLPTTITQYNLSPFTKNF